jgi:hypothetical protein
MKEKAMNEDRLCRNMAMLMLCAAVLGLFFYCRMELRKARGEDRKKILEYELAWPDEKDGREVVRKERYFLDEETGRTWKIEKYLSDGWGEEYVLEKTVIIDRTTDEEEEAGETIEDVNE